MHALKLALNKSMRTSDDEQGINKLWPDLLFRSKITFTMSISSVVFKLVKMKKQDKKV